MLTGRKWLIKLGIACSDACNITDGVGSFGSSAIIQVVNNPSCYCVTISLLYLEQDQII